jgi:hypothetical protein
MVRAAAIAPKPVAGFPAVDVRSSPGAMLVVGVAVLLRSGPGAGIAGAGPALIETFEGVMTC